MHPVSIKNLFLTKLNNLNSNKKLEILFLILILSIAFILRFYKVTAVPNGLYYDEVDAGYQARSIIGTGKSYRGVFSPFYVQSFLDPRTPIPIYFTVITTLIFNNPELAVRMPSVIEGIAIVFLVYLLIKNWTKRSSLALITSFIFAINPWELQFSRFSQEANSTILFILLSLVFMSKAITQYKYIYLILGVIFLSFDVYTYRAMSLTAPLIFIVLILIFWQDFLKFGIKKIIPAILIPALIIIPFLYATTIGAPDIPRIDQISIFSDPMTPILIQRARELESQDGIDNHLGKTAIWSSYLFNNKPLSWIGAFTTNYIHTFSTDFLFVHGDNNNLRHSIKNMGYLFYSDIIALIFGFLFISKNLEKKYWRLILGMLLITPMASSLTADGAGHGVRLFTFSVPLLILVGTGWWYLGTKLLQLRRYHKFSCQLIILSLLLFWLSLFVSYLHSYYTHYSVDSASWFGYGFKQATADIMRLSPQFKEVDMSSAGDPPMLYYLFWSNTDPKLVQLYGSQFSKDIHKNMPLDKYKVVSLPNSVFKRNDYYKFFNPNTLYLLTENDAGLGLTGKMPPGMVLFDKINYPDGAPAFYLVSLDPKVSISGGN